MGTPVNIVSQLATEIFELFEIFLRVSVAKSKEIL
jgi:hypothetical protein